MRFSLVSTDRTNAINYFQNRKKNRDLCDRVIHPVHLFKIVFPYVTKIAVKIFFCISIEVYR